MSEQNTDAFQEYYSECDEILQRISISFSNLDKQPELFHKTIDSLYRDIHTLKGTSQLFGFLRVGMIAHAVEACLEPVRSGSLRLQSEMVDQILKCLDLIELTLNSAKEKNQEVAVIDQEISAAVAKLMDYFLEPVRGSVISYFSSFYNMTEETSIYDANKEDFVDGQTAADELMAEMSEKEEKANQVMSSLMAENSKVEPTLVAVPKTNLQENVQVQKSEGKVEVAKTQLTEVKSKEPVAPVAKEAAKEVASEEVHASSSESVSTIRVQVSLLDRLMNLVGELVLIRNQVQQFSKFSEDHQFLGMSQRLDVVTSDLQGEVMRTRMQPVGTVLTKFTRTVRDLSRDLNKKINFEASGVETELDKTLIEAIKDPLTHIIRNSCDHGIETPAERKDAGKAEMGLIHVTAKQESGHVIIEIQDDGRGLDTQKIINKAIEKGILSSEKASALSEQEAALLIFAPGFSTAEKVTAVSGRGVGMDVVRTNIERIGGSVEVQSVLKKGTTIRLKIPLTLAIVPALIIESSQQKFSIPQVKLVELVRVENEEGNTRAQKIEMIQGQPIYRLRGQILPLVSLNQILSDADQGSAGQVLNLKSNVQFAVLSSDQGQFGLIIDEVIDTADIVVKPLEPFFKKLLIYSGATIMGDGSVSIILDVTGIAQKVKFHQSEDKRSKEMMAHKKTTANSLERQDYLSVGLSQDGHFLFPLTLVHRLEEIKVQDVESGVGQDVVNYRGIIMPLLGLDQFFNFEPKATLHPEVLNVIVIQRRDQYVGIVVNEILDVINAGTEVQPPARERSGVHGNLIVEQDVYTVIDILSVIDDFMGVKPGVQENPKTMQKTEVKKKKILLAEDTSFFVKQVVKMLESDGHRVTVARDGEEAWKIIEAGDSAQFDLLVSDIEMPVMNGFDLIRKIRADQKTKDLYAIAVTTRFSQADRQKGIESGFNQYLEKLRKDELLEAIRKVG